MQDPSPTLSDALIAKRDRLLDVLRSYESCAVAMSAGVDSTLVAKAAYLAMGDHAVAVTGVGPSLADGELDEAKRLAARIGIRHEAIPTTEATQHAYTQNAPDRCYHCKTELYDQMAGVASRLGVAVLVNGANADDLGDYRPGMTAATENRVRSPLLECDLHKSEVRELARHWDLPVWDKPAAPCLASRIAYGQEVTPERLRRVDQAEQFLREAGLGEVRVRYHAADLARVEVPARAIAQLVEPAQREALVAKLKSLGFKYITLDLEGFRSGNLNEMIPVESLMRPALGEKPV